MMNVELFCCEKFISIPNCTRCAITPELGPQTLKMFGTHKKIKIMVDLIKERHKMYGLVLLQSSKPTRVNSCLNASKHIGTQSWEILAQYVHFCCIWLNPRLFVCHLTILHWIVSDLRCQYGLCFPCFRSFLHIVFRCLFEIWLLMFRFDSIRSILWGPYIREWLVF